MCLLILRPPIQEGHQDFVKSLSLIGLIRKIPRVFFIDFIPLAHQSVVNIHRILPSLNARRGCDRPGNTPASFHGIVGIPDHNDFKYYFCFVPLNIQLILLIFLCHQIHDPGPSCTYDKAGHVFYLFYGNGLYKILFSLGHLVQLLNNLNLHNNYFV